MGLSGVAVVTATAAAAVVESAGAAFWVSGFVPRPLTLVRPRNSRSSPPLPPLRPHEVRKGCCARGARMWNSRSAHSVTPACRGLPLLGACTLMRYVRPTVRTPLVPVPSAPSLHPSALGTLLLPLCSSLSLFLLLLHLQWSRVVSSRDRLRFIVGVSLRDSVSTIASRSNSQKQEKGIISYT